jgi:group I intron endonuclease
MMHIYKFTHIDSGRCYIGQTIQDPEQRRREHISDSKNNPKEYHFHNALRKYGESAFTFEVIDTASSLEELNLLEEKYVEKFNSIKNGFNIRQAGGNKLHSEESKERMRAAQRAAHARRREQNNGVEKHSNTRSHKGKTGLWNLTDDQKEKHRELMSELNKKSFGGKTWKVIDGKRTWLTRGASV